MNNIYRFTQPEITRLLLAELERTGKIKIGNKFGVITTTKLNFGQPYIDIELSDPIPGAPNL